MSTNCSHNCAECHSDCNERTAPQSLIEPLNKNSTVKKVIGVVSGKGGVGKSLVTSMLAVLAQRKGYNKSLRVRHRLVWLVLRLLLFCLF